jgi:hypothetical protein
LLEEIYKEMSFKSQERTAGIYALHLERASAAEKNKNDFSMESLRSELAKAAHENYDFREGLLLLIQNSPPEKLRKLREILAKRDARFEKQELLAAFSFLYK